MMLANKISGWLKEQVTAAGARGCVVGLSGGIDSAVVALLCQKAFPAETLTLLLPCHSLEADMDSARRLAERFQLKYIGVDLGAPFDALCRALPVEPGETGLAVANIKPRLRMITLYYYAQKLNYLVVGTGNRSELEMGYFTKYGDGGVDLLPLGNLTKSEVRALAKELGVPQEYIEKAPSAGLWAGQTDEGEMGITYEELDKILAGKGGDKQKERLVNQRRRASEHKRRLPPIFTP
ncbi:MAG: NAD(+) synthase [Candidatus Margulisbacteria bacterium]|jgi:NAD+ synthase|nr:NAD(+) synthase [Candidatus Margulisiibacteriota bacterium]